MPSDRAKTSPDEPSAASDERIVTLVESALSLPPGEREEFLRAACGGENDVYRQALSYLRTEERMGAFLLDPIGRPLAVPLLESGDLLEARFRIVRTVAE